MSFLSPRKGVFIGLLLLGFCKEDKKEILFSQEELPPVAYVVSRNTALRSLPFRYSALIKRLEYGEKVSLLKASLFEESILGKSSRWYYVETLDHLKGWVYGAFLSVESPKKLYTAQEKKEVLKELQGLWVARVEEEEFGILFQKRRFFLYYQKELHWEGKWEVLWDKNQISLRGKYLPFRELFWEKKKDRILLYRILKGKEVFFQKVSREG